MSKDCCPHCTTAVVISLIALGFVLAAVPMSIIALVIVQ